MRRFSFSPPGKLEGLASRHQGDEKIQLLATRVDEEVQFLATKQTKRRCSFSPGQMRSFSFSPPRR
jgi:hypothetical protein